MTYIGELARFVFAPVLVVGAAAWLSRAIVKHYLSKDIDRFKDQLAQAAKDRETQFTILQSRRAAVIEELYGKLIEFMAATEKCVSPLGYKNDLPKEDQLRAVGEAQSDFFGYYVRNRIFFSEKVCEGIDSLLATLVPKVRKFGIWLALKDKYPESLAGETDAWDEAWDTMQKQVPPIMKSIEADFRSLLGVETPR